MAASAVGPLKSCGIVALAVGKSIGKGLGGTGGDWSTRRAPVIKRTRAHQSASASL